MKNLKTFSFLIIGLFIIVSCNNKAESTNEKATTEDTLIVGSDSEQSSSILGLWVSKNKGRWIEFLDDGTFNMGMDGKENVEGREYELDMNKSTITIQTKKATKIFRFNRKGNDLYIKIEGSDKEIRYSMKESKPE